LSTAAIFRTTGAALEVRDDVVVDPPQRGEVLLDMAAAGVCHSDLSAIDGTLLQTPDCIMGHEGAAVVTAVGEDVTRLAVGDRVVVSWVPKCGECFWCTHQQPNLCDRARSGMGGTMLDGSTRASAGGRPLKQMAGTGTFASQAVMSELSLVRYDVEIDPVEAALIGCGVLTGVGAAMHTSLPMQGASVAVLGCGGVGLNVVQGARLAGAQQIIAVDMSEQKLELAKQLGATDTVLVEGRSPVGAVMALTEQRGVDVAFEVIGLQATIDQTIQMTRRGGEAVLVGIPKMDAEVRVPAFFGVVLAEKSIRGSWYGSSDVDRDVPKLLEWYAKGDLHLDALVSNRISLSQVNEAVDALRRGEALRSVVTYG
jgi:Zn-dependent alcohol dehydrogenase